MDNNLKEELYEELNLIKRLLRQLEKDGDVSIKERNTIMKHVGAIKAVLKDDVIYGSPDMAKHVMRQSKNRVS